MRKCLIVTGGTFAPLPEDVKRQIQPVNSLEDKEKKHFSSQETEWALSDYFVIACDSGYRNAQKMGVVPDLILGDFDSADRPEDADCEVLTFPTRKDDTDTMLAVKYAIREGCRDIHIACAFGGRFDHAFSNIQAGAYVAAHGGAAQLYGANEVATVFGRSDAASDDGRPGASSVEGQSDGVRPADIVSFLFPRREGFSLSVFSLSDKCEGVTISGTKYEVADITIFHNDPVGTSNVWVSDAAEISIRRGILLVMESRLAPGEHI